MYDIGFIGFGEAARAFVRGWHEAGLDIDIAAFDLLFDDAGQREQKFAECRQNNVIPVASAGQIASSCTAIICAVTPDQVDNAARSIGHIQSGQIYLDINSSAPDKKKAAALIIGAGYFDVAVLAPVHPGLHTTPLLVAGPASHQAAGFINLHFPQAEMFSETVGDASLVKMIRSIFVKGLESITMECALAAYRCGHAERIFGSLDNVLRFTETHALADYTMERMATHGLRRSAEMEEVCATLNDLGLPNAMSQGSMITQKLIGDLKLAKQFSRVPPDAGQIAEVVLAAMQPPG